VPRLPRPGVLLRTALSLLLLLLLVRLFSGEQLWRALRRVPVPVFAGAIAVFLCVHLLGAVKWGLLLKGCGAPLPLQHVVRFYLAGLFSNVFVPSVIGGDLVSVGLALRRSHNRAGLIVGSLLNRALDFACLVIFAEAGALMAPQMDHAARRIRLLALGGLLVGGIVILLGLLRIVRISRFPGKVKRLMVRLRMVGRAVRRRPGPVLLGLVAGLAVQAGLLLVALWVGTASGLEMPVRLWLFGYPLAKLAAFLPVTQGGIGVREVAFAAVLLPLGIRPAAAVAASLAWEVVLIGGGLLAGGISLALTKWIAGQPERPECAARSSFRK
jgi:hypothetical protein